MSNKNSFIPLKIHLRGDNISFLNLNPSNSLFSFDFAGIAIYNNYDKNHILKYRFMFKKKVKFIFGRILWMLMLII